MFLLLIDKIKFIIKFRIDFLQIRNILSYLELVGLITERGNLQYD